MREEVLNNKTMFSRNRLPRLTVEKSEREKIKDEKKENWGKYSKRMESSRRMESGRVQKSEEEEDLENFLMDGELKRKGDKEKHEPRPP